jgi:hypothetical protein
MRRESRGGLLLQEVGLHPLLVSVDHALPAPDSLVADMDTNVCVCSCRLAHLARRGSKLKGIMCSLLGRHGTTVLVFSNTSVEKTGQR